MIVCNTSNLNNIDKATPTNFQLVFPLIPTESSIASNNPFVMNIFSAVIPSLNIGVNEISWQGNKVKYDLNPLEFESWMVNFVVDSRLDNWSLLFRWMSYINNNCDKIAEYHKEYSVDASMIITNNYKKPVMEIVFVDIWPTQLAEIGMSQREGDIVLESMVTFEYDYFYVRSTAWTAEFSSSSRSSSSKSWTSSSSSSLSSSSSSSSLSSSSSSSSSSESSSSLSSSSSSSSKSSSSKSSSSSTYLVGAWSGWNPNPLVTENSASYPGLIDGNIYAVADNDYVGYNTSFWVATTEPMTINGIIFWFRTSSSSRIYDAWVDNDSGVVGAYKSDDGITWEWIDTWIKPPIHSPSVLGTGYEFAFRVDFDTPQTARWFKLRNDTSRYYGGDNKWGATSTTEGGGVLIYPCEIEYYNISSSSQSSSSESSSSLSSSSSSESSSSLSSSSSSESSSSLSSSSSSSSSSESSSSLSSSSSSSSYSSSSYSSSSSESSSSVSSSSSESSSSVSSSSSESSSSSVSSASTSTISTLYYTIDSSKIDENLTNFPVGINVSGTGFISSQPTSGWQNLHVTVSGGNTELYTEVDVWEPSNDRAVIWTKVPFIPSASDTVLKLEYGSNNYSKEITE